MWRERLRGDVLALSMVLGGALGNIVDRVRYGYVVDYADLHFGAFRPFYIFNLADAAITIGVLTATTYTFGGLMREQVCTYMCPWPRIQAALTDEYALNVTYRYDRGEPRCSAKKAGSG